jgi:nucleotide-binding universal stress UspA family protein
MSNAPSRQARRSGGPGPGAVARIAVGIDGYLEGRDAAVLGATIARATGAELMLVAVHPDPLVVLPRELGWTGMHRQAEALLRETRDAVAPGARIDVETDWSVTRALERVVTRERRDLLVVGSSRHGPEGRVRIGNRTRQLLYDGKCALAVPPRGLSEAGECRLASIGVGYDGGGESKEALALAGRIAVAIGAPLRVRAVVDDRVRRVGWSDPGREQVLAMFDDVLEPALASLREDANAAVHATGADAEVQVVRGTPADVLAELSAQVDLVVIGSRRWGARARVLLGSVGETLMHGASCPILVVPRADAWSVTAGTMLAGPDQRDLDVSLVRSTRPPTCAAARSSRDQQASACASRRSASDSAQLSRSSSRRL